MKYELEALHDFGKVPKSGVLKIYEQHIDDEKLLVSIFEDLLKFPAPLIIRVEKRQTCSEDATVK